MLQPYENLLPSIASPDGNARLAEADRIFAVAHKIAKVDVGNQRIYGAPIEPRGATAAYDEATGRYTLRSSTQGVGAIRDGLVVLERKTRFVVDLALISSFLRKLTIFIEYEAWDSKQLAKWLREHKVPVPKEYTQKDLQTLVKEHWNVASEWTYEQYDKAQKTFGDLQESAFDT